MQQQVKTFADRESLSHDAAHALVAVVNRAIKERGYCSLVLSGGSSPLRLYALLAKPPFSSQIEWEKLHVFWTDERCVGPDDERSNYHCARSSLLDHVPLPTVNIHRMPGEIESQQAALESSADIKLFFEQRSAESGQYPSFDCVLLGMGVDGHIASLFPGKDDTLHEGALVIETIAPEGMPVEKRLSMSLPLLAAAHEVFFIVCGSDKQPVVDEVISGSPAALHYPASRICERSRAVWFVSP